MARPRLPALEKNILKFRALQMVLLLHQVETLRTFVLGSIRATDKAKPAAAHRLPAGAKRPLERALAILVTEDIITPAESADIQSIIDLRNKIGHAIHHLVADISAPSSLRSRALIYDYYALNLFEQHRAKIWKGMARKFILLASLREGMFEEAESTYKEELDRLRRRIEPQYERRKAAA